MTIYFIQAIDTGGPIKIGFTTNIQRRLPQLRMASPVPLCLIRTIEGDSQTETRIHFRFAHLRMHGEWFKAGNDLLEFIKNPKELPSAPVRYGDTIRRPMVELVTNQDLWPDKIFTTSLAVKYIRVNFHQSRQWYSITRELEYQRKIGNITHELVEMDSKNRPTYLYRQSEIDRFIANYDSYAHHTRLKPQSGIDFSKVIYRMGKEHDVTIAMDVINPRTGKPVSVRTVYRERKRLGIPTKVTQMNCGCGYSWKTPKLHSVFCPKCRKYNKIP